MQTKAERKAAADAAALQTLQTLSKLPVPEPEAKPKRSRAKKPKPIVVARSFHTDDQGKVHKFEITVPPPPERAQPEVKATFHKKFYTIREGNEEEGIPELKIEKRFGPYDQNRAMIRAFIHDIRHKKRHNNHRKYRRPAA